MKENHRLIKILLELQEFGIEGILTERGEVSLYETHLNDFQAIPNYGIEVTNSVTTSMHPSLHGKIVGCKEALEHFDRIAMKFDALKEEFNILVKQSAEIHDRYKGFFGQKTQEASKGGKPDSGGHGVNTGISIAQ